MPERITLQASFNAFIFSNFFISLSAVTLTLSSYLILGNSGFEKVSVHLILFIFFSTLFIYNYFITSYSYSKIGSTIREKWIGENKKSIKAIFLISASGIVYNSFFLAPSQLLFLGHLGFLSLVYISPLGFGKFEVSLRSFPLLKIFILTYVWASSTVILPAMDTENVYDYKTLTVFIERFIFILALAIPFDIRDYSKDKLEKVTTIPGLLGVENAKNLSIALLSFYIFFSLSIYGVDYISVSRALSGLLAIFLISKIEEGASDSFYMFCIDGVMVFHFVVLAMAYVFI